jgi:ribosomal protein S20
LAKTPRKWTGARSPSGLKRVRSSARRHAILEPRRSAAKTLVKAAMAAVASPAAGTDPDAALAQAMSALDRAAKVGAIHPNQAARRKSRLAIKVFDAQAGVGGIVTGTAAKTVSKAQAQKAAKARIAAGKADKAKGAQTAAGKARAALHRTTRGAAGEAAAAKPAGEKAATAKAGPAKAATAKAATAKATTAAPAAKAARSKAAPAAVAAEKSTATKGAASKTTATRARKAPAQKAAKS